MKVTVGRGQWRWSKAYRPNSDQQNWKDVQFEFSEIMANAILGDARDVVARTSSGLLRTLKNRLESATLQEAVRIFATMERIIDERRSDMKATNRVNPGQILGINTRMLEGGAGAFRSLNITPDPLLAANYNGQVPWFRLSENWLKYKSEKWPQNAGKFFKASGNLFRLISSRDSRYVESWLGGIKVDSEIAQETRSRRITRDLTPRQALADIHIRIFPKVAPTLVPGLASRRWSDVDNNGLLERRVIRAEGMREKLVGKPGRQRPLFQPVLQFWMLYRIPRVINVTIQRYLRGIGNDQG